MEIQITQIIFQIINFSIIVVVLTKFIYKPILKIFEQRTEKIDAGVKAAEKNLQLQSDLEAQRKDIVAKARKEAESIKSEARKDAESKAADIIAQAKTKASKTLDTERKAMLAQIETEKTKVQKNMADLITKAVSQILKDGLSEKDQRSIISSQIKKLKFT